MSNPRENREQDARAGSTSLAQATASGGMIAVVAVILLASWILKADPRHGASSSARKASANPSAEGTPWNLAPLSAVTEEDADPSPTARSDAPILTETRPSPQVVTPMPETPVAPRPSEAPASMAPDSALEERELTALQVRAVRDAQRLAKQRGAWVAQIAAVCNEDHVAAHVQKAGGSERFYILPVTIKDRVCYRMLWGTFDSAAGAAAADLPSTLKSADKLRVLAVKELIP